MISNKFGATVGVAIATVVGDVTGLDAGGGACTCRGAADKHKLGVRADFYKFIIQSNTWGVCSISVIAPCMSESVDIATYAAACVINKWKLEHLI